MSGRKNVPRPPRPYRWLMRTLPRELRQRFGGEIEELFAERLAAARSRRARLRVWTRGIADLAAGSLAERTTVHPRRNELMGSTWNDVRFTLRSLRRAPGFALVVLLTLALGIGATTAVFSVVNAVLLRPLPYAEPQQLVMVWPQRNSNKTMVHRVAEGVPALESVSGIAVWTFVAAGDGAPPEDVKVALVSPNHFDLLGTPPMIGRTFRPEEATKGNAGVVVLAYDFWAARYGADPEILGRQIRLAGADYDARTVIGVMPPDFRPVVTRRLAGWVTLEEEPGATLSSDSSWYVNWTIGRLSSGASVEQAEAQLRTIAPALRREVPSLIDEENVRTMSIDPLHERRVGRAGGILWLLLARCRWYC